MPEPLDIETESYYDDNAEDNADDGVDEGAAQFRIPLRNITALEHPLLIKNLEKGLKTFGWKPDYDAVGRL